MIDVSTTIGAGTRGFHCFPHMGTRTLTGVSNDFPWYSREESQRVATAIRQRDQQSRIEVLGPQAIVKADPEEAKRRKREAAYHQRIQYVRECFVLIWRLEGLEARNEVIRLRKTLKSVPSRYPGKQQLLARIAEFEPSIRYSMEEVRELQEKGLID